MLSISEIVEKIIEGLLISLPELLGKGVWWAIGKGFSALVEVLEKAPVKVFEFLSLIMCVFINALAKFMMELMLGLIKIVMKVFTISADMFNPNIHPELSFMTDFYHMFRTLGIAFLVLIAMWQVFKSFFAYVGFEAEEPLKIGIRIMIFGTLIMKAKEIVIFILSSIYDNITKMVWSFAGTEKIGYWEYVHRGFKTAWGDLWNKSVTDFSAIETCVLSLLVLYMTFKLFLLCFKLVERYMLTIIYVLTFPLALSTGISKATRQYLQGWIRGFVGNLLVQLSQILVFVALGRYWNSPACVSGSLEGNLGSCVIGALMGVALVRALDKVEEFIRDIGLSAGISSGPVQGPLEWAQSIGWKISGTSQVLGYATKLIPGLNAGGSRTSANEASYASHQMSQMNRRAG